MTSEVSAVDAPKAVGPYSQAIRTEDAVYCSAQIALDPETGQLVGGGVAIQTEQVLRNLAAVLAAAGSGLEAVVKTTVFLVDMGDWQAMNDVYSKWFTARKPARSTAAVVALPRGALVAIDCIARR